MVPNPLVPSPGRVEDHARTLAPRRLARITAGAAAIMGAPLIVAGADVRAIALVVAASWVLGRLLGSQVRLGRRGEEASAVVPILGATLVAMPVGAALFDLHAWVVGVPAHAALGAVGARFARLAIRRAPARELAAVSLHGGLLALAVLFLAAAAGADLGPRPRIALGALVSAGVPHVPLLWWLVAARVRGERFAGAAADATVPAGAGTVPIATLRRVHGARFARVVGAALFLVGMFVGIVHTMSAPDPGGATLTIWALLSILAGGIGWAAARVHAELRFDARVKRLGEEAAMILARRLECASVTLSLAAWLLVLPTVAAAAVAALVHRGLQGMGVEAFLERSLADFFPCHLLLLLCAVDLGVAIQATPTHELRVPWARIVVSFVAVVMAAALWVGVLGERGLAVMVAFSAALLCLPPLFAGSTLILLGERWALEATYKRSRTRMRSSPSSASITIAGSSSRAAWRKWPRRRASSSVEIP